MTGTINTSSPAPLVPLGIADGVGGTPDSVSSATTKPSVAELSVASGAASVSLEHAGQIGLPVVPMELREPIAELRTPQPGVESQAAPEKSGSNVSSRATAPQDRPGPSAKPGGAAGDKVKIGFAIKSLILNIVAAFVPMGQVVKAGLSLGDGGVNALPQSGKAVASWSSAKGDVGKYKASADKFEEVFQKLETAKKEGNAQEVLRLRDELRNLRSADLEGAGKSDAANKSLKQAFKNAVQSVVDTTGSLLQSAMKLAGAVINKANALGSAAKGTLGAIPVVGVIVGAVGIASSSVGLAKGVAQIRDVDARKMRLDAAAQDPKASGTLGKALDNVAKHAGTSLGKERTGAKLQMLGSAVKLFSNVLNVVGAALTLGGITAPLGLAIAGIGIGLGMVGSMISASAYAVHKQRQDNQAVAQVNNLDQALKDISSRTDPPMSASDASKALAGENRYYAAMQLVEQLGKSDMSVGSEGEGAMKFLRTALGSTRDAERIIAMARDDVQSGAVGSGSPAVKELMRCLYGG